MKKICRAGWLLLPVVLWNAAVARPTCGQDEPQGQGDLFPPVRVEADGEPIDIGKLSGFAHAGPCLGDVDGDGDRDLLVGDFPGYFWYFENTEDDKNPVYTGKGQLQAGDEAAKTPVY
jgi:hypothetical protein